MEKYLLTITVRVRIAPDPNQVVKATTEAAAMKAKLWVLGAKGSRTCLQGDQVAKFGQPERYMKFAEAGLLYVELDPSAYPDKSVLWAFAPTLDSATGLPTLMERFDHAFAKRQPDGQAPAQAQMSV
ncbi:MAG: hypothetical protein JNL05_13000 [Flavobacteriales bacterium]|nr:hypothetical protein [Flavobacteriales bacterium]